MSEREPIKILQTFEDHTIELDENSLEAIFMQEEIKDRFAVIVSLAGAFRKGKSFLLNFIIRYMDHTYMKKAVSPDWLGDDNDYLTGFSWRSGSKRDTTGILMWSHIYFHDYPNGKKVAIFLLDTQGVFDSQSTVRDCVTIFALSTMVSSVQIFNLSQNIQENDLQHLQFFTEYGRLALENSGETPFQQIIFLVRDWSYPYEANYGAKGGNKILNENLEIKLGQHEELKSVRKHIKSCFESINGFLMPYPGQKVAEDPNFKGCLKDISTDFKVYLKEFVPQILAPENLRIKKINGREVRAGELLPYIVTYANKFKGTDLPEPKSLLTATIEATNSLALVEGMKLYVELMKDTFDEISNTKELEDQHFTIKTKALDKFFGKKMGDEECAIKYLDLLQKDIQERYSYLHKIIEEKGFHEGLQIAKRDIDNDSFVNNTLSKAGNNLLSQEAVGTLFTVAALTMRTIVSGGASTASVIASTIVAAGAVVAIGFNYLWKRWQN